MEGKNPDQRSRREKLAEIRERFKGLREDLLAERDRRKAIMLKRHALFTSLISDCATLEEFYKQYSELFGLLGIDMYFIKRKLSGRIGIALWIQLDYTEYEEYFIYEKNGKLSMSDTVSWQNEVCANEYWNIMSDSDDQDNEEDNDDYWVNDDNKNEAFGYEPYW